MTAMSVAARHRSGDGRKGVDKVLNEQTYRPREPVKHRKSAKHEDTDNARVRRTGDLYAAEGRWRHRKHKSHRAEAVRWEEVPERPRPQHDAIPTHGGGFSCPLVLVPLLFPVVYFGSHLVGWWLR